jgi:hypothetical protein
MQQTETDPRRRFFNEEGDSLPPFRQEGWRGCGLDRDRFNSTRLPRFLFETVVAASGAEELLLRLYTPDRPASVGLPANWASFSEYVHADENWSLEYVLYDSSGRWAVLADPDVTVVGAELGLADAIERMLGEHGTSFEHLTKCDFPGLDPANPNARFMLAVLGSQNG